MAQFDLIIDEKVTVWRRSYITVNANTLKEAVNNCIESGSCIATDILNSEYIFDTEEYIPPSENDLFTVEVMDRSYNTLKTNVR